MQTLSTTTYVGSALIAAIQQAYPSFNFTFASSLQYPFSEVTERGNSYENPAVKSGMPLFVWNRSALRNTDLGSRGSRFSAYAAIPNVKSDATKYRTAHCEFDFNFTLVDKDIATIESFEIDYLSKEGLGRITEIHVDLSSAGLGVLKYFVTWDVQLNSFDVNMDSNAYCSVSGSARVGGWFISLYGETPLITSIDLGLRDKYHKIETDIIS